MRLLFLDLDTLRPDHLGCYGYHRDTSPNIDRIADSGTRFNEYYVPDAPCLPARAALLSGRFGIHNGAVNHGGSRADDWARRIAQLFTRTVKEHATPAGFNMIPGLFSWALTAEYGKDLGATPDGRHAGDPINQGANPYPGFREDGAPTALVATVASVQCGYGNTAPLQIDLDPGLCSDSDGAQLVESLIRTHFDLGGTMVNMNVLDKAKILEAHKDPSKYPGLIVRVTGFSAYFSRLSPGYRQLVVDRIVAQG